MFREKEDTAFFLWPKRDVELLCHWLFPGQETRGRGRSVGEWGVQPVRVPA